MNRIKRNTPGTPSITKEAKIYDGLTDLQEAIRMAARLDDRVKQTEKYNSRETPEEPKETPIVTPNEINDEMYR